MSATAAAAAAKGTEGDELTTDDLGEYAPDWEEREAARKEKEAKAAATTSREVKMSTSSGGNDTGTDEGG